MKKLHTGDVVDHPDYGRGIVWMNVGTDTLWVWFASGFGRALDIVSRDLTLREVGDIKPDNNPCTPDNDFQPGVVGERAIITHYGHRTPATYVAKCDRHGHERISHWCFEEPTPDGATWASRPDVAREPILAPRAFQPGAVVDHPEHGRGIVQPGGYIEWGLSHSVGILDDLADDLTLVLPAPDPPAVKPPEPQRLGSVVLDGEDEWVLADPGDPSPWYRRDDWRSWDDMPDTVTIERGDDQ